MSLVSIQILESKGNRFDVAVDNRVTVFCANAFGPGNNIVIN